MITAIKNVRVFNGITLTEMTNVVFDHGYITSVGPAVPPMSEIIEGYGLILQPGKVDERTHDFDIGKEAIEPGRKANFGLMEENATTITTVWRNGVMESKL
jgi:dihydroorotase-like cyclic amidohydrolase